MKRPTHFLLIVSSLIAGLTVGASISYGQAASGKTKQCGDANGANNKSCPKCGGNCSFAAPNQPAQKYKVCAGAGTGCTNTVDSFCSGVLMDGGPDGKGCDGNVVTDGYGFPVTCQTNKFKTCK